MKQAMSNYSPYGTHFMITGPSRAVAIEMAMVQALKKYHLSLEVSSEVLN